MDVIGISSWRKVIALWLPLAGYKFRAYRANATRVRRGHLGKSTVLGFHLFQHPHFHRRTRSTCLPYPPYLLITPKLRCAGARSGEGTQAATAGWASPAAPR